MKKIRNMTTITYKTNVAGFMVDVVTETINADSIMWEAWLYHKDYGVKDLIIGVSSYYDTETTFMNKIEQELPRHIEWYRDEYMHDDEEWEG